MEEKEREGTEKREEEIETKEKGEVEGRQCLVVNKYMINRGLQTQQS